MGICVEDDALFCVSTFAGREGVPSVVDAGPGEDFGVESSASIASVFMLPRMIKSTEVRERWQSFFSQQVIKLKSRVSRMSTEMAYDWLIGMYLQWKMDESYRPQWTMRGKRKKPKSSVASVVWRQSASAGCSLSVNFEAISKRHCSAFNVRPPPPQLTVYACTSLIHYV